MKKIIRENFVRGVMILLVVLGTISLVTVNVNAQSGFCEFFPCDDTPGDDTSAVSNIDTWAEFAAGLVFVGFIIFGVLILIKASLKIIQSEGDEGKVQEGMIAIRSVMIAVSMLIAGIIGLILLLGVFGKSDFSEPDIEAPPGVNEIPFIT